MEVAVNEHALKLTRQQYAEKFDEIHQLILASDNKHQYIKIMNETRCILGNLDQLLRFDRETLTTMIEEHFKDRSKFVWIANTVPLLRYLNFVRN